METLRGVGSGQLESLGAQARDGKIADQPSALERLARESKTRPLADEEYRLDF